MRRTDATVLPTEHASKTGSNLASSSFIIPGINVQVRPEHHVTPKLLEVEPKDLWDAHNNLFLTCDLRNFTAFLKFQLRGLGNFTGEFVVVCGFSEKKTPWVLLADTTDPLFETAATHDFRSMAEYGKMRGSLNNREQYLRAPMGAGGTLTKYASVKLECGKGVRNVISALSIYKGSWLTGFLFRD